MRRRAPSRPAILSCALCAAVAAGTAARAARLPDWAQPLVAAAPALASGVARDDARVLFRERRIEIQPDGTWIERVRVARQALTARSAGVAVDYFPFDERCRIRVARAWHQPPGERAERSGRSSQVEIAIDNAFISDSRARFVAMEGVQPGSLVFFEFEATVEPYILSTQEIFLERGPIALARFEVATPPGWTVRAEWLHHADVTPRASGTATAWELHDVPGMEDDPPLAPSPRETAPCLAVAFDPPPGVATRVPAVADWPALAAWFLEFAAGADEVTPEIRAAAEQIAAGAGTLLERIHAVGRAVRDRVRYTARLVGVGGYRPENATKTLRDLHGECKAKSTLARAVLAALGIPSYTVMVSLKYAGTVPERIPLLEAFDHQILAVPIASLDESAFGPAVADGGELGPLAIVDPTDEYTAIGWVAEGLSGRRALVVAPGQGRLVTLPGRRAADHRVERRIRAELKPGDTVALERTTRIYGAPAARERWRERSGGVERRREQEQALREQWLDAKPAGYAVEWEAPDGAFVETMAWTMPVVRAAGAPLQVPLFVGEADLLPRPPLGKRTAAVRYATPLQLGTEVTLQGFPASAVAGAPRPVGLDGWSSSVLSWPSADGLHVRWTLVLERTDYPAERFGELRKLYGAVAGATSATVSWEP